MYTVDSNSDNVYTAINFNSKLWVSETSASLKEKLKLGKVFKVEIGETM